jgi:dihydroorotase
MRWLVKNGLVSNRKNKTFEPLDILGEDKSIVAVQPNITQPADQVIDARGCFVLPGLVDLHAHVAEPGDEQKENLSSLAEAAIRGGFTDLLIMPDTHPPRESVPDCLGFMYKTNLLGPRLFPAAKLTKADGSPTEWGQLAEIGIKAIGDCVPISSVLMRRALSYLSVWNVMILADCLDPDLSKGTHGREGVYSTIYGIRGVPAEAEEMAVLRDLLLTRLTNGRLHIQHISTQESLPWLKMARQKGIRVSSEVSWLHLLATDADLEQYDTNLKLSPPLGNEQDRLSLIRGVKEGLIDCIVTDHTPYAIKDKDVEFDMAPPGAAGLELFLPALYAGLVKTDLISLAELCEAICFRPSEILTLPDKELVPGNIGDMVIFDPQGEVDREVFCSYAANYPQIPTAGCIKATVKDGKTLFTQEVGRE